MDEEVNNPDNYSAAKYSVEYRLSVTHADGSTEHFSEHNLENWHNNVLNDSYTGLYESQEAAQNDVEQYRTWQLQEGDEVIGESLTMVLQPQVSFVLMDQYTGEVKAISGGRGEKTASRTLNRASDVVRQPGSVFKVITCFAPAIDTCGKALGHGLL